MSAVTESCQNGGSVLTEAVGMMDFSKQRDGKFHLESYNYAEYQRAAKK
jgi:hypothetical protein